MLPVNMNPENNRYSELAKECFKVFAVVIVTLISLYFVSPEMSVLNAIAAVLVVAIVSVVVDHKSTRDALPMRKKVVLVTGCDSGFGHELAVSLSIQGVIVYAGCLNKDSDEAISLLDKGSHTRLRLVQMDVTKPEQITEVRKEIETSVGKNGLWGVVNNAGLNFGGDVELTTLEQFERVMDINYMGIVRVTKEFIPLVRMAKGRFVNVTSVKGVLGVPGNAAYCASKYAGEAFSDILRMEMKKFDVKVSIIEPCNFGGATNAINIERMQKDFDTMWENLPDEQQSLYGYDYISACVKQLEDAIPSASFETYKVVDSMEDALFSLQPKTRYLIPGSSSSIDLYRWRSYVKPFLPDWIMDYWLLKDIHHFPKSHT